MTFEMNRVRALAGVGLVALLLVSCKPAATSAPAADDTQTSPGAVAFANTPPLSDTVAAAPRLVGDSAPIAAINGDLALIDAMAKNNTSECEGGGGGFVRTVSQPMTGPAYVSYMVSDEYDCGGPYPSTSQTPVTYDLATGRRVDWTKVLSAWAATVDETTDMPAGSVGYLHSLPLARWYSARMLAGTDQEWLDQCRDVFDPEQLNQSGFLVWADAGTSGIAVAPQLAHVVQACGEHASLTAADMQAAGVPAAMIAALATAGEGRNWLPYEEGV